MNLQEEILKNAGITDEYIVEGIKFFKNSVRLDKLIKKIEVEDIYKNNADVKKFIALAKEIKMDFMTIENKYAKASKEEKADIKMEYKNLSSKNYKLIQLINKETFKKALKGTGIALGVLSILFFIFMSTGIFDASMITAGAKQINRGRDLQQTTLKGIAGKISNEIGVQVGAGGELLQMAAEASNKVGRVGAIGSAGLLGVFLAIPGMKALFNRFRNKSKLTKDFSNAMIDIDKIAKENTKQKISKNKDELNDKMKADNEGDDI